MTNYIFLIFDALGFVVALGMAYYAFHMINQMKTGRLEKSWKYMTRGALIIAIDAIVLMMQIFGSASNLIVVYTTYVGATFAIIGGFLIMLGFREHYLAWSIKLPKQKPAQAKKELTVSPTAKRKLSSHETV